MGNMLKYIHMDYEINDISDKKLKFGYFVISNLSKFKQALTIFLALICLVTVSFSIYGWTNHFIEQKKLDETINGIGKMNLDFEAYHNVIKPKSLEISEATVIYSGDGKYDFVAKIVNPNERWQVDKLVYKFQSNLYTSPSSTVYLLPNQERYLVSYANQSQTRVGIPELQIVGLEMTLIKPHENLPDTNFTITDMEYTPSGLEPRSKVTFKAFNNTIYNFWETDFLVLLYSNDQIVGVNQTKIEEFLSNMERVGEVSWFEKLPRITKVEVYPYVDLLDTGITYKIPGEVKSLY